VSKRFEAKVVVVTGAAGGIGSAACRLFAREGAQVVVTDRDETQCAALVAELTAEGLSADYVAADLKHKSACEKLIQTTMQRHSRVDVLVNNAGIIPRGDILDTTDEMWHDAFAVNMHAIFYLSRAAIPHMRDLGGGAIVNTSSTWGVHPGPNHVAYVTTKGAVASFTKSLARDCAPLNIRVNAVAPNEVNTPMLRSGFEIRGLDPDKAIEELGSTVPLGRIAEPEEIASTMVFLASEEASYICGAVIEISGAKAVYG
jgi:meso-butanediol dehydrogenase/(S,S)-butanediol dehydrogenase/diacetyl reductase